MNLDPYVNDKQALANYIKQELGAWPTNVHAVMCEGEYDFYLMGRPVPGVFMDEDLMRTPPAQRHLVQAVLTKEEFEQLTKDGE